MREESHSYIQITQLHQRYPLVKEFYFINLFQKIRQTKARMEKQGLREHQQVDEIPASLLQSTKNPTTTIPDVASSLSTGLQISISLPENDQTKPTEELSLFSSLLFDVRLLLSRPDHTKFQLDHSIF